MRVGFTGSRFGTTPHQRARLARWLQSVEVEEFHHGDCVGADHDAHLIALDLGIHTVAHPPRSPRFRAWCDADEIRELADYMVRNHAIVDETDLLIATPDRHEEVVRSGTWATVRYARSQGKVVVRIDP